MRLQHPLAARRRRRFRRRLHRRLEYQAAEFRRAGPRRQAVVPMLPEKPRTQRQSLRPKRNR